MYRYVKFAFTLLCLLAVTVAAAFEASALAVAAGGSIFVLGWLNGVADTLLNQ